MASSNITNLILSLSKDEAASVLASGWIELPTTVDILRGTDRDRR